MVSQYWYHTKAQLNHWSSSWRNGGLHRVVGWCKTPVFTWRYFIHLKCIIFSTPSLVHTRPVLPAHPQFSPHSHYLSSLLSIHWWKMTYTIWANIERQIHLERPSQENIWQLRAWDRPQLIEVWAYLKEVFFYVHVMLGAIVIICVSFLLCSFGGITINTEKEKCKNEEEFERKLSCKFFSFFSG